MGSVMIGYFPEKDGVISYRICGTKADIYEIINEAREMGHKFADTPIINHVHRGQWSTLLKLKTSSMEVCQHDKGT